MYPGFNMIARQNLNPLMGRRFHDTQTMQPIHQAPDIVSRMASKRQNPLMGREVGGGEFRSPPLASHNNEGEYLLWLKAKENVDGRRMKKERKSKRSTNNRSASSTNKPIIPTTKQKPIESREEEEEEVIEEIDTTNVEPEHYPKEAPPSNTKDDAPKKQPPPSSSSILDDEKYTSEIEQEFIKLNEQYQEEVQQQEAESRNLQLQAALMNKMSMSNSFNGDCELDPSELFWWWIWYLIQNGDITWEEIAPWIWFYWIYQQLIQLNTTQNIALKRTPGAIAAADQFRKSWWWFAIFTFVLWICLVTVCAVATAYRPDISGYAESVTRSYVPTTFGFA